jgi:hypothetical protein
MAVVGLADGMAVAGMSVLRAMAMATDTRPTGPCMATIGLTGATGSISKTNRSASDATRRVGTAGRPRHLRDHRTNADAAPGAAAGHPGWAVEPTCRPRLQTRLALAIDFAKYDVEGSRR